MADNTFYISAGLPPIDNSTGATANTFYISAGLVPDDTTGGSGVTAPTSTLYGPLMGPFGGPI